MKRIIIPIIIFFFGMTAYSQISPDKYYVQFTDKNNSPYSIANPEQFLSQRSIDRRAVQNIPIDSRDLPVNPQYLDGVRNAGAVIINPTKWLNGVTIQVADPGVITTIEALPYVANVKKSLTRPIPERSAKPFFDEEQIGVKPPVNTLLKAASSLDYGPSYSQISMLRGNEMHDLGYRGDGMIIGVLDAGFTNTDELPVFDTLWDNGRIIASWDFVENAELTFSTHYHGTMVLSTMGGNYPGEIVGTAPDASYILIRTEDGGSEYIIEEYNWVSGAEYADSIGADVLNTSLSYSTFDDQTQNHVYEDMDGNTTPITIGADIAASKGMAVVNSAGNDGSSSWYYITAPADGDSVFTIGAVNAQGTPAGFSGNGPTYDNRVKPNVVAQGEGSYIATTDGGFTYGNGTSFSSPIMAGMVACLWQANPNMKNTELYYAIEQNSSLAPGFDYKMGYGIPDFIAANNYLAVNEREIDVLFDGLNIFPNPFTNVIRIEFRSDHSARVNVSLTDMTGRVVYVGQEYASKGGNNIQLSNIGDLPAGIYFLRMESDQVVLNSKIIKQ